ncbi:MAG: pyridoxal phosphate-dependent aminotransferase [Planctomycetes bacterium]|nr:pyridoxal phosphate-dependent aminotransferase [Planctomycetota bacterium]
MARLAQRVRELAPSQTLALSAKANELAAAGHPVINFSVGEPDFTSPQAAMDAGRAAIDAGDTHYPPVPGTASLRKAIVDKVAQTTGRTYGPQHVLVSNGAKHTLYNLLQVLVDPGDEVAFASPYWVSYPAMVQLAGGLSVPIPTRASDGFRLDPAAVDAALGPRVKALILNSPCNPTGAVADPADVEAVVRIALDKGVTVISDEIYGALVFGGAEHRSAVSVDHPGVAEGVILVDGVSKSYAMTGWRIGYCVGPEDVIKAAGKIQGQSTSGACTIAQAAAAGALRGGDAEAARMRDAFAARRDVMLEALRAIPGVTVPEAQGAFYAFPDVSSYYGAEIDGVTIKDSLDLSTLLLERAYVGCVPGGAFGADAHLRLSYALAEDQIREGVGRIAEVLAGAKVKA